MSQDIQQRARFDIIRYANCWEDADVLCEALQPGPGRRILSIASGGDNAFALIARGAGVVAADLSAAQLACVELKAAAIRQFSYDALLVFLGIEPSDQRLAGYAELRAGLSARTRAYWDANRRVLARGLIHAGKFERYFRLFRTRILPLVHGRRTVRDLLAPRDAAGRTAFYDRTWNNLRWRLLFRVFFSRFVMGRMGRDPEFFRYVQGSVAARILARTRYALTVLPTHDNPYLDYILTGDFSHTLPPYLVSGQFDALKAGLARLTLFEGPVQDAARAHGAEGFDGFNLSDIFEYLDENTGRTVYERLLDAARPGARFAYWNMLAPRAYAGAFPERVRPCAEQAAALFKRDRAFFYSAFVVEEVLRGA
ncbi:MAG: DUF3419 family protein [Kiritimatiellae bacterium]|nr:DUF3419 family protein [Kiritimatiellia bacterium]